MRARIVLTLFFLALGFGAVWDYVSASALSPAHTIVKGLAQADWSHNEDRSALGAAWWYGWSDSGCSGPCVNMSKFGALSSECYPYLLFLNEPENTADVNLTPAQAVPLVVAQQAHCPATQLVMGNSGSLPWLQQFIAAFQAQAGHAFVGILGYHSYCYNDAGVCVDKMSSLPSLFPGYRFWVSEFNCLGCSVGEFTRQVSAVGLSPVVDRFAAYTNRQPCSSNCSWVLPGADLVNGDGTITASGAAYAGWQAWQAWLPSVGAAQGYP